MNAEALLCNPCLIKSHFLAFIYLFISSHGSLLAATLRWAKERQLLRQQPEQPLVTSWWKWSVLIPLPWIQDGSPGAEGLMRIEGPATNIATPAVQAPHAGSAPAAAWQPLLPVSARGTARHGWRRWLPLGCQNLPLPAFNSPFPRWNYPPDRQEQPTKNKGSVCINCQAWVAAPWRAILTLLPSREVRRNSMKQMLLMYSSSKYIRMR